MLDGLLGRGFASKCKSLIKVTRTRIDVIRRKRNATQKFLKKDISDLLSNGLDINAYGRTEGLLAELTLSSCYDFVEKSGEIVLKHLSAMQKQRECPEECRVAISSLMFAAARFSDLPELRDLRNLFQERYENSLEYCVDQKFVENLSSKPFTMEKKIRLMQEIAQEFSIKWDSRVFEQTMSRPSPSTQDQPKNYGLLNRHDVSSKEKLEPTNDGHKMRNGKEGTVLKRNELGRERRQEVKGNGYESRNVREETPLDKEFQALPFRGRQEVVADKHEKRNELNIEYRQEVMGHGYKNGKEEAIRKNNNHAISFQGRPEVVGDKHDRWNRKEDTNLASTRLGSSSHGKKLEYADKGSKIHNSWENTVSKGDNHDTVSRKNPDIAPNRAGPLSPTDRTETSVAGGMRGGKHDMANSVRNLQEEEIEKLKSHHSNALPPPYVKPNVKPKDNRHGPNLGHVHAGFDNYGVSKDPVMHNKVDTGNRSKQVQKESGNTDDPESHVAGALRVKSNGHERDHYYPEAETGDSIAKPRSMRRRRSKSRSNHDDAGNFEDTVTRKSRSRRRDDSRRGLQVVIDDDHHGKDEEERIIDKLLMHYSKKPSSYDPEKVRRKSKSRHAHHKGSDMGESPLNIRDHRTEEEEAEIVPPPARSISLPNEQITHPEAKKVYARAASFQPDRSNPHVHPKLPDYDDLAARFASLRGR